MKALVINCYQNDYYLSSLSEMDSLLTTLKIDIDLVVNCSLRNINKATFISKGVIEKCALQIIARNIDIVVFNNDLSSLQVKNLRELLKVDIYDRSMIIIKIFELRAKSKEAKLQVEIASLKYNSSRLIDEDANYDQVTSGKGKNKGLGEKINDLKKNQTRRLIFKKEQELIKRNQVRAISRKNRLNSYPLVAICGYTNAGKSTLMNCLIERTSNQKKERVLEENRLFASLDTATRLIKIDGHIPFLLTDTVGFISNLPTHLINSFRSTLEEIELSDLIIEVIDVSSENFYVEKEINENIIKQLTDKPIIRLYNKADLIDIYPNATSEDLVVSLKQDEYIEQILGLIDDKLSVFFYEVYLYIPYEEIDIFYQLKNSQVVVDYYEREQGIEGTFKIYKNCFKQYAKYLNAFKE